MNLITQFDSSKSEHVISSGDNVISINRIIFIMLHACNRCNK